MPWKKLSPAQSLLMERLANGPLDIDAKVTGYGWRMPLGVEMRTIDALEKMGAIKRKITGQSVHRKMTITLSNALG